MTHIITSLCLRDGACVDVCPVECIVPGKPENEWPWYFIDPDTCIDCGACVPECPYEAIFIEEEVPSAYTTSAGQERVTMAGQRILLVARDGIGIHALEEIVGLVVFADVVETEVPVLARVLPALGRAVRSLVGAACPLAHGGFFIRTRLRLRADLVGLDANGIEELG